jgi:RNA polymerase sigma factor (TIGR02999 family)
MQTGSDQITGLLIEAAGGNKEAFDRLLPLVYRELAVVARGRLRFEAAGHTLNTTALVHEAYLKLADQSRVQWRNRHHFFAVASEAMRRILIDYAKQRLAAKRGGGAVHLELEAAEDQAHPREAFSEDQAAELVALDDALAQLAAFNPQGAKVVQYRFFGGLSNGEAAEVLGVSERTVRRSWTVARAWLRARLEDAASPRGPTLLRPEAG